MFRLACCLITERGVRVCALVHDAVLIEAPLAEIEEAVSITRKAMAEASREISKVAYSFGPTRRSLPIDIPMSEDRACGRRLPG